MYGPTNLWQYLGTSSDKPWIPYNWQAECLNQLEVPCPIPPEGGTPHPRIWAYNCGRRVGKTALLEKVLWLGMLAPADKWGPPTVRLTADTEEHGHKVWDQFTHHLLSTPLRALLDDYSRERELVKFATGASAQLISANNPNALAGDGVTLWVIDEAQYLTFPAWQNLYPSTTDRNGVIVMAGVSEFDGPFREACFKGQNPVQYPEYRRKRFPTWANPDIHKHAISEARKNLSPTKFAQLYEAEWAGEEGQLFRNIESCVNAKPIRESTGGWSYTEPYHVGNTYYGGLDLGRLQDWSVYTIWNRRGELVAFDRFHIINWDLQVRRCAELSAAYGNPLTIVDSTGIGDPVFQALMKTGMRVDGYQIATNFKKNALIDDLALRFMTKSISIPDWRDLRSELTVFEAKRSKNENSNLVIYSAPAGQNDDCVLSCALGMKALPMGRITPPIRMDDQDDLYQQPAEWDAIPVYS